MPACLRAPVFLESPPLPSSASSVRVPSMRSERATKRLTDEGSGAVSSSSPPPALLPHSGSIALPPHNIHHHHNSNNQGKLLDQFRAALDHKEAQIETLRLRSDGLLKSLRLKDLDVQHLQQAVEDRNLAIIRYYFFVSIALVF